MVVRAPCGLPASISCNLPALRCACLQVEFGKVGFRTNRKLSKVVPQHLEGQSSVKVRQLLAVKS